MSTTIEMLQVNDAQTLGVLAFLDGVEDPRSIIFENNNHALAENDSQQSIIWRCAIAGWTLAKIHRGMGYDDESIIYHLNAILSNDAKRVISK